MVGAAGRAPGAGWAAAGGCSAPRAAQLAVAHSGGIQSTTYSNSSLLRASAVGPRSVGEVRGDRDFGEADGHRRVMMKKCERFQRCDELQ